MNKELLQELKSKLEKEKKLLDKGLGSFATKDKKLKGDWDTRFPQFGKESGGAALEKAADEVEEYSTLWPIEYDLEIKLRNIDLALEKIKKGRYGICEKCRQPISIKRLKAFPEAQSCLKCEKQPSR